MALKLISKFDSQDERARQPISRGSPGASPSRAPLIGTPCRQRTGFTIMEGMFAAVLVGVIFLALYGAITWGFLSLRSAREDLKATQIMVEKMEVVRLCSWDQILSNALPTQFTVAYSGNVTNKTADGPIYSGNIEIGKTGLGVNYEPRLRLVTVSVNWTNRGMRQHREISTYVSRYGINKSL